MKPPSTTAEKHLLLLEKLASICTDTEREVVNGDERSAFVSEPNFFVKLYLINLCTVLESFLTERAFDFATANSERLRSASVPLNFLSWSLGLQQKSNKMSFGTFAKTVKRGDIADLLSPQPHKTVEAFAKLGVDLENSGGFSELRELVRSIVNKRNKIIHHDDHANDVSFGDIRNYVSSIGDYLRAIDDVVETTLRAAQ